MYVMWNLSFSGYVYFPIHSGKEGEICTLRPRHNISLGVLPGGNAG